VSRNVKKQQKTMFFEIRLLIYDKGQ